MTPLELLAPARNADIGIAAISCGADAVYIGGPSFGARKAAGNSVEDISRLCREAQKYGVKVFVTVNTLCRDDQERQQAASLMRSLRGTGVSAFIIQDCTLLPLLARDGEWEEEFHASTQCAIRTPERALELVKLGFSRLVLEREISLEQIRAIRRAIPSNVELEFFVHGALCVCYSGECYLSELLTGRSANRGECAQPCRNLYDLVDGNGKVLMKSKPLLSLKDFQLIGRLEDLAMAGVSSFKIEGRLKNESYVKNVVRAYSDRLDSICGGKFVRSSFGRVRGGFTPDTDKTFNRGYTTLFIDGRRGDWNSGDAAKGTGEYLGTAGQLKAGMLHNGDGLCYVDSKGEVVGFRIDKVEGGHIFSKVLDSLPASTRLWRNRDNDFERTLEKNMPSREIDVELHIRLDDGASGIMKVEACSCCGITASATLSLEGRQQASNRERMAALICSQLGKSSGIYHFHTDPSELDGVPVLPLISAAELNALRRNIADSLAAVPILPYLQGWQAPDSLALTPASELSHKRTEGELMRTKYCILHQIGACRKTAGKDGNVAKNGLYLVNNTRRLCLGFDCKNCEMTVTESQK